MQRPSTVGLPLVASMVALVCAGAVASVASVASADPLPLDYVRRPLTLPRGMLRLDGEFAAFTDNITVLSRVGGMTMTSVVTQTRSTVALGAGYGITDDLDVRVAVPVEVGPDVAVQDALFEGRYRFTRGAVEVGGALTVHLPTRSDAGLDLGLGVPLLVRAGRVGRLDIVPTLDVTITRSVVSGLAVPVYYEHRLAEGFSVGIHTGVTVPDFTFTTAVVPLGVFGRLSLPRNDGTPLGDLLLRFDFDRFLGNAGDTVDIHAYTITFAGRLFLPLLH